MPDAQVKLPDRAEMLRRLTSVTNDSAFVNHMFPPVLAEAGKSMTGRLIVLLLVRAAAKGSQGNILVKIQMLEKVHPLAQALIKEDSPVRADVDQWLKLLNVWNK